MAESNKILTVSYGTFSCTLEGFDDAFSTMKAIAEYFRDLAAEDRFFGAEPPTPDTEMLAQLASRTASRRVEAHRSEDGIVLRQQSTALDAPRSRPQPQVEDIEEDDSPTSGVEEAAATAPAPVASDAPAAEEDVRAAAAAPEADLDDIEIEEEAEEEPVAAAEAKEEPAPRRLLAQNKTAVIERRVVTSSPAPSIQPARPRVQVTTSRPVRMVPPAAAPAAAPHPDQNSVAAKLARIRGVVARTGGVQSAFSEDEHADLPQVDDSFEDEDDSITAFDASDADLSDTPAEARRDETAEDIDLSAAMAIANAPAEEEGFNEEALADDDVAEYDEEDGAEVAYDEDDLEDEDDIAASAQEEALDENDEDGFDEDAFFADDEDEDEDAMEEAAAPAPAAKPRPVARVLKVKRTEFEAAVLDGTLEEDDDAGIPDAILRGESTLSAADEAELQSELQALEEEIARGAATPVAEDEDDTEEEEAHEAEAAWDVEEDEEDFDDFPEAEDEDEDVTAFDADKADEDDAEDDEAAAYDYEEAYDDEEDDEFAEEEPVAPIQPRRRLLNRNQPDMDRILKETNHQLGDSEGNRRRSAIAHLRAAVAATKADKQAGAEVEDDEQEVANAYRDDLAQVVRPRRPVARHDTPARRADDRPAPLKLVAEQRVDLRGANVASGPVRPRRVRVADLAERHEVPDADAQAHARAAAAHAASFNEFADRVGAVELPDLLEAAASYLSFVEGLDQFTRPQLMSKARQAMEEEFSREDGLRHFGRLLREGKLRKVTSGHFTVSDRINFRPEERAAG